MRWRTTNEGVRWRTTNEGVGGWKGCTSRHGRRCGWVEEMHEPPWLASGMAMHRTGRRTLHLAHALSHAGPCASRATLAGRDCVVRARML